eukprot:7384519-Prymnesium_polylepis.1
MQMHGLLQRKVEALEVALERERAQARDERRLLQGSLLQAAADGSEPRALTFAATPTRPPRRPQPGADVCSPPVSDTFGCCSVAEDSPRVEGPWAGGRRTPG